MDFDAAADGLDDAGKLGQEPIAYRLDHSALMLGNRRLNQLGAMGLKRGERAFLVSAHQPAVAGYIGGENCSQTALCHDASVKL